jgi:hypothetical protein
MGKPIRTPRPGSYWLARHYPGWVSRLGAADADPLAIARQIERLAGEFLLWLDLPIDQRWDTYIPQSLAAVLFSRYQLSIKVYEGSPVEVSLFELHWPPGSEAIVNALKRMQTSLAPLFAVFHAAQQALTAEELPTPQELAWADNSLLAGSAELKAIVTSLQVALAAVLSADSWHTVPA